MEEGPLAAVPEVPPAVFHDLNGPQSRGDACIVCGAPYTSVDNAPVPDSVVVGTAWSTRRQVRACQERCARLVGYVPPSTAVQETLL